MPLHRIRRDALPRADQQAILPSCFPPPSASDEDQAALKGLHIERAMRILPHLQDTGGFFVAVIKKVRRRLLSLSLDPTRALSQVSVGPQTAVPGRTNRRRLACNRRRWPIGAECALPLCLHSCESPLNPSFSIMRSELMCIQSLFPPTSSKTVRRGRRLGTCTAIGIGFG